MIKSFEQFNKLNEGVSRYDKKNYYTVIDDILEDCINGIKEMLTELGGSFEFDPESELDEAFTTLYPTHGGAEDATVIKLYINKDRKDSVFVEYSNGKSGYMSDMILYGDIIELFIVLDKYMQNEDSNYFHKKPSK